MRLYRQIRSLRGVLADLASGLALAERRVKHFEQRSKTAGDPKNPHPLLLDRAHKRLIYWREVERKAYLRRHHFRVALQRAETRLRRRGPIVIHTKDGPKIVGGTPHEKLAMSSSWAAKHWHDYYNEVGSYDEGFALTNAHFSGKRRDCSWYYYEDRRLCGFAGKTTEPRWTGSLVDEGREVSKHYAETHLGVAVVYGDGPGFHVGKSTGHGPYTWQHGTPTLSTGSFNEFGPGTRVRYFAPPSA